MVGPAVNIVSRLEGIAKASGKTAVCSGVFASALPGTFTRTIGRFELKGLVGEHDVFTVIVEQVSQA